MSTRKIGFIGMEKYELMQYLSRILYHLKQEVLLVDLSDEKSLEISISPQSAEVFNTRGIDFSRQIQPLQSYDYQLIDFGFHTGHPEVARCDILFYVADLQVHNLNRINVESPVLESYLIIKDALKYKINLRYIRSFLDKLSPPAECCIALPFDKQDKKCALSCMWDAVFRFQNLSSQTQDFLYWVITKVLGFDKKDAGLAYKKAERGE